MASSNSNVESQQSLNCLKKGFCWSPGDPQGLGQPGSDARRARLCTAWPQPPGGGFPAHQSSFPQRGGRKKAFQERTTMKRNSSDCLVERCVYIPTRIDSESALRGDL